MLNLSGAFLFFTTGGLIFDVWYKGSSASGYLIGSGIIAFLNGSIYLGDLVLASFQFV